MPEYVAGFLFSMDFQHVVLIRKRRPAWMVGFCNAVGGHIEANETPEHAMVREFWEETGVRVHNWHKFATLDTRGGLIYWYWAIDTTEVLHAAKTQTDEEVRVYQVEHVLKSIITSMVNLNWLIGMALNGARGLDTCEAFTIVEHIYRDAQTKETT